jgi:hypothetical protein
LRLRSAAAAISVAGEQPRPLALALPDQPVAVVLDLMNPERALRRLTCSMKPGTP